MGEDFAGYFGSNLIGLPELAGSPFLMRRNAKKLTLLVLCVAPKPDPIIVIGTAVPLLPNGPVEGETEVIVGGCSRVKWTLLLLIPPTTTVTGPLVALFGICASTLVVLNLLGVNETPLLNRT